MTNEFKKAVEENDLKSVRMMLTNELIKEPSGKTFEEMLAFAKERMPDLFVAEEPSKFAIPADKSQWDTTVRSQMKRDLNMNFSVEKLALFIEIVKYVGAEKAASIEARNKEEEKKRAALRKVESAGTTGASGTTGATGAGRTRHGRTGRKADPFKTTGTILTGSGAAIAITSICLKSSVLAIIGGGVLIGGVFLLCIPRKK